MFAVRGFVALSISVINLLERLQSFFLHLFLIYSSQKPKTFHQNPKVKMVPYPILIPPTSLTTGLAPLGRCRGLLFWCFQLCWGMDAL